MAAPDETRESVDAASGIVERAAQEFAVATRFDKVAPYTDWTLEGPNLRRLLRDRVVALRNANIYEEHRYRHTTSGPVILSREDDEVRTETIRAP